MVNETRDAGRTRLCTGLEPRTGAITKIRGNSYAHVILLACIQQSAVLLPRGRPAAEPARGQPARRGSTHRHHGGDGAFLPFRSRSQPTVSGAPDRASDTSTLSGACLGRRRSAP